MTGSNKLNVIAKGEVHLRRALEIEEDVEEADLASYYLGIIYFKEASVRDLEKSEFHVRKSLKINENIDQSGLAEQILGEISKKNEKK